jgi:tyramine---L-glutamate ligase
VVRIFVCEYITGGGLYGAPWPASLLREGELMVGALVGDLLQVDGVEVALARDPRLAPLAGCTVRWCGEDAWREWRGGMEAADAVWPIAPESGGVLERLSELALNAGRVLLGSRPEAVRIAASKRATAARLAAAGVPVVGTVRIGEGLPASPHGWVRKPDDGAGCADTVLVRDPAELGGAGECNEAVVQPYLPGTAASLSALCRAGEARLLACNRQLVRLEGTAFRYAGSEVNALHGHAGVLEPIARGVAAALPDLWGYVGIDLVLAAQGPVVLEVNPRLTTSYAGLHASIGRNPAALVLGLLDGPPGQLALANRPVNVELDLAHAC